MRNLFKIAVNAFRESLREPVYALMLLAALILIAHYPSMSIFVFSEQLKLVVDSSMATGLLFGLVIAVLCASNTVAREMRNGTVLLLLSKPVARWSFVLGKILGITAAATLFTLLCNLGCVISVFVATDQFRFELPLYFGFLGVVAAGAAVGMFANFWRGSSFPEICSYALAVLVTVFAVVLLFVRPAPSIVIADLLKALLLVNFAVAAMATIAVVAATRLDVVPNLCVCTAIFFLGMLSNFLFQRKTGLEALDWVLGLLYSICPNWQFFWLVDAVAVNKPIPVSYVLMTALYTALYIVLASLWAVAIFSGKEAAGDSRN